MIIVIMSCIIVIGDFLLLHSPITYQLVLLIIGFELCTSIQCYKCIYVYLKEFKIKLCCSYFFIQTKAEGSIRSKVRTYMYLVYAYVVM